MPMTCCHAVIEGGPLAGGTGGGGIAGAGLHHAGVGMTGSGLAGPDAGREWPGLRLPPDQPSGDLTPGGIEIDVGAGCMATPPLQPGKGLEALMAGLSRMSRKEQG